MIIYMTLWIVILSMIVILTGLCFFLGEDVTYIYELQDMIRKSMWVVITIQYSLFGLAYVFYRRMNDRAN